MTGASSPPPAQRFTFATLSDLQTCAPTTINWTYTGPQDFVVLVVAFASQESYGPLPQDFASIITPNISTTAEAFVWPSVDISGGPYMLSAVGARFLATSPPFFVANGTDTSCIVAMNGTVIASPLEDPTYAVMPSTASHDLPIQTTLSTSASTISTALPTPSSSMAASALNTTTSTHLNAGVIGSIVGGAFAFAILALAGSFMVRRKMARSAKTAQAKPIGLYDNFPSTPVIGFPSEKAYIIDPYPIDPYPIDPYPVDPVPTYPTLLPRASPPAPRRRPPPPFTFTLNRHLEAPQRWHMALSRSETHRTPSPASLDGHPPVSQRRESSPSMYSMSDTLSLTARFCDSRPQSCLSDGPEFPHSPVPSSAPSQMYHGDERREPVRVMSMSHVPRRTSLFRL